MTEKELNKIIVSGLDCVKAEDSVKARIKRELTGDTTENTDIVLNTKKADKAEVSNDDIKADGRIIVNDRGRIAAVAAAVLVFAGAGYVFTKNMNKIKKDDNNSSVVIIDSLADSETDSAPDSETDSEADNSEDIPDEVDSVIYEDNSGFVIVNSEFTTDESTPLFDKGDSSYSNTNIHQNNSTSGNRKEANNTSADSRKSDDSSKSSDSKPDKDGIPDKIKELYKGEDYSYYKLSDTRGLVVKLNKGSEIKDLIVYDLSSFKEIKHDTETADSVEIHDMGYALISVIPDNGSGFEHLSAKLFDNNGDMMNVWDCKARRGYHFVKYDSKNMVSFDDSKYVIWLSSNDISDAHVLTKQTKDNKNYEICYYESNGHKYDLEWYGPEGIDTDYINCYCNDYTYGWNSKGEYTISRRINDFENWETVVIPDECSYTLCYDFSDKTCLACYDDRYALTSTLYIVDWDTHTCSRKDFDMPSDHILNLEQLNGGRYLEITYYIAASDSSVVRVYDLQNDLAQVCSVEIPFFACVWDYYNEWVDPSNTEISLDESTGILKMPCHDYKNEDNIIVVDINIFDGLVKVSKDTHKLVVPDIYWEENSEWVEYMMELYGLNIEYIDVYNDLTVPEGCVIRTEPPAGTEISKGDTVKLYVNRGVDQKPKDPVKVPDVKGIDELEAKNALLSSGLKYDVRYEYSDTVGSGKVLRTDPDIGTELPYESKVTLYISKGPKDTDSSSSD